MDYTTIKFEVRDAVAYLTLNRPEAANSINLRMAQELLDAATQCDEDPAIRALLLSGAGAMFCAGGDLKGFALHQDWELARDLKTVTAHFHAAISRLVHMDPPVVAAIHGSAAGAGMSLVCACDLPIAAASARFTMAYTRAGLTPDGSGTYFLPRLVGLRRAVELTLTNRMLSADEALQWGIVTRVVPDASLMEEAGALARQIAEGPTQAMGQSKRLLIDSFTQTLESQMENESQAIARAARGAESREGIAAFMAKRAPRFPR